MTDYSALRAQTIGSTQEEEAVTVNTRALIDKVLARYSSENTTLRELLQNAADANATSVEVRYDSVNSSLQPSHQELDIQDLTKQKMRRMLVKNNGHSFREEDWQRLKRIAEGNPDETKIGAFGVGFYSVFADCEEPFVSSGDETMIFYWKENTLVTRRHKLKESDPYTTFLLEYREPTELPDLKELCKFFATSLTFVKLNEISLYVNDRCLLHLKKKTSPSEPLAIPSSINPVTTERLMKIAAVETERLQIDAKYMNITHHRAPIVDIANGLRSIFSRFSAAAQPTSTSKETSSSNLTEYTQATIFLRIATATVTTSVSTAFARELERATKKPPPKTTKIAMLSMSKDELDASEHKAEIFSNVLPSKSGKIFIGFPTHQTTSISAHISAPSVIPTVERENIDLNARVVKQWNIEMLRISGILSRIIFTDEMLMLGQRAAGLKPENLVNLYDHAIHIMQQFTFAQSTPSPAVGRYIESEFWNCSKKDSIELLSTKGVLSSDRVRVASDVNFLEGMPLLPEKLEKEASVLVAQLKEMGMLTEITISDIRRELGDKALSGEQLGFFLKWLAGKRLKDELDVVGVKSLLEVAVATTAVADSDGESFGIPISLGSIKFYINAQKLSADIPAPPDCLPFNVTKSLTKPQLDALGWEELGVTYWLQYICVKASALPVEQNIQLSAKFAQSVLAIISKGWEQLPPNSKENIVILLKDKTCIPTRQGMKVPRESYFNTVKLFSDLPLVESMHGVRDKLLVALGVRKTVDLKLVFERLMNGSQAGVVKWSHVDLIKYLTSVGEDIPREDITKLKNTAICKAEGAGSTDLYKVSELYEPSDGLRKLKLPILQWPGIWREGSNEAKFLSSLGLKRYPGVQEVLQIAGNKEDAALREAALSYFIFNYHLNSYHTFNAAGVTIPFLPLNDSKGEKGPRLVTPWQCFSNPKAAIMGFDVLRQDLQQHGSKFGVKPDPDMKDCVDALISSPPSTNRSAREKFGYFSTRLADIMPHLVERLSQARIVPVPLKARERIPSSDLKIKFITPRTCFLGGAGSQYFEIFDFVDFGQEANSFLLKCGSKHEPTVAEVAYMMVREPQRLYGVFNSSDKYLSVLRSIAESWTHLKRDKILVREMRRSPFLGSFRWRSYTNEKSDQIDLVSIDEDDSGGIREFVLARVDEVLISDDYVLFLLFRGEILAAPQEDALEGFYQSLGVQRLSSKVSTDWNIGHVKPMPEKTEKLRKLVLERSRLFLHNNTEEVLHDARWLENNLRVEIVESIRLRRTLRNEGSKNLTHQNTKTATITMDTKTKWWVLYLTPKFEYYDVSQALVTLILRKPRPHSSLLLDSLLHNDLMTLKSRGYNVDRILRAKAAEARMAEEQRLKQAEIESKAIEEQEKRYQQSQMQLRQGEIARQIEQKKAEEEKLNMPGAFGESPQVKALNPPAHHHHHVPDKTKNNFFGRLSKHLGFEANNGQMEQMQNLLNNNSPQQAVKSPGQIEPGPIQGESKPDIEKATEPHRIQANLQRAIGASRGHNSDSVFSPPQTFEVKEAPSYCDNHSGQDILYFAETPNGVKVFVDRKIADKAAFAQKYVKEMNEFSNVLKDLSGIFGLSITTLHIFYDEVGNTIAFNTNGSLFCNLRFYLQLHAKDVTMGDSSQALIYWFVVLCHELAHNLVQVHDEKHSFYTETFVQEYFVKIMTKLKSIPGAKPWDINI
ncbi:hypothetical protein DFP73DRAFT_541210 [Morchella snyderi]|nr:hypothetical protein DFP73DRAFT_541210 [Morchella snyderi]